MRQRRQRQTLGRIAKDLADIATDEIRHAQRIRSRIEAAQATSVGLGFLVQRSQRGSRLGG